MKNTLALLLLIPSLAQAQPVTVTSLKKFGQGDETCTPADYATEPLQQRAYYIDPQWKPLLNTAQNLKRFDPKETAVLDEEAGVVRSIVSSAHLVNLLADTFRAIQTKESQLIRNGQLKPLIEGKTYSLREYNERKDSVATVNREYTDPKLRELYHLYLMSIRGNDEWRAQNHNAGLQPQYYRRVELQREVILDGLRHIRPSILAKLGTIAPIVKGQDLPLAYRDGYLVKIQFKKAGAPYGMTLYPHMIQNQISGFDTYFVRAMARWKDYCYEAWQSAKKAQANFMASGNKRIGLGPSPLIEHDIALTKRAYDTATQELANARWVHDEAQKLTKRELYSLLDLFRQLRFDDMPLCSGSIVALNRHMTTLLRGESSSSSKKFTDGERKAIDRFAKDVVFYQDMYTSFSDPAADIAAAKAKR